MASNATAVKPQYFETIWAAFSTIGLNNVLVGLMIAGIRGRFSAVILVPIVTSAACAISNGLYYYVSFSDAPAVNRAVAYAFSDFAWLVQEGGLPFYGYAILAPILYGGEHAIYLTLFWGCIFVTVVVRVAIAVVDVLFTLADDPSPTPLAIHLTMVNRLHLGYFIPIAMAESVNAVFLLKKLRTTLRSSISGGLKGGKLYRYLIRSAEIRLASLALIGIPRSITFFFHMVSGPLNPVSQIDLFIYTLGCLFPIILFVDILASRLVFAEESAAKSSNIDSVVLVDHAISKLHPSASQTAAGERHDIGLFAMSHIERDVGGTNRKRFAQKSIEERNWM
ncbi:uncharacterized protein B0I36DRAFT_369824 [Microdochium trichocladiopsis]|uniref:Uncharacterized protein n=1 Tax=Microdochium trichocladiopsis TaxID=1682393 RepID=A0A9P8XRD8_9PEZI|nr:uncharacterized protein B0I36DRAFT_369824 [Microdochium trichocladiopsis]KAH7012704.1 hypothetical protein B0I36DRAFT_369824 [Microdochium trichocladiopsis]